MFPGQLRAFHAVIREGGFTRAARALGVSQPALSAAVGNLETAYGVTLFERRGRGVVPTELGLALRDIAARHEAAEDEARTLLQRTNRLERGHLRVSADSPTHSLPIIASLKRRHPGLAFSVRIGNSDAALRDIAEGTADVAVMAREPQDPRLHALALKRDHLVLLVPSAHPWAKRRRIAIAALAGRAIVVREPGSVTREAFERALSVHGVRPGERFEIQTREAVFEAVATGFGVGAVFASEVPRDPRFAVLTVRDADLGVGEYVVCSQARRRIATVRAFLEAAAALAQPAKGGRG